MNWYQGSIAEAVVKAKTQGAIFVVYVEGKDEKSTHLTGLIDDQQIVEKLNAKNWFVSIKLQANTLPHQQFCEIYKETPIPSIYFIGKQGTPLEIVKDCCDVDNLSKIIDDVVEKAGLTSVEIEKNPTIKKSEKVEEAIPSCPSTSSKNDNRKEQLNEIQIEQVDQQIDEKVERAKQLIGMKREEKQRQQQEEERLKEVERRKLGKNLAELKRWQNEQELKQLHEEREREKRANHEARQRILEQIAQDKAERKSKFTNDPIIIKSSPPSTIQTKSTINSNIVRLQFRIPDGKSVIQDFQIDNTLDDVHEFIKHNIKLPFNKYILSTTIPKREFTNIDDNEKNLLELELAPSAVLLILPIGNNGNGNNSNTNGPITAIRNLDFNNLFWSLFLPFINIFNYLKSLIFTSGNNDDDDNSESNNKRKTADHSNRFQSKRRGNGRGAGSNESSTIIQRQGNVHRLSNRNDSDDDENNTWNGNSTQQM